MANTATAQTALPINVLGVDVIPYVVAIDTVDTDLTIHTPVNSRNCACIVGIMFSEGTAATLTFKSGSTTYSALELAANQGLYLPISGAIHLVTQPGEALKIRSSAAITNMLVYVVEAVKVTL